MHDVHDGEAGLAPSPPMAAPSRPVAWPRVGGSPTFIESTFPTRTDYDYEIARALQEADEECASISSSPVDTALMHRKAMRRSKGFTVVRPEDDAALRTSPIGTALLHRKIRRATAAMEAAAVEMLDEAGGHEAATRTVSLFDYSSSDSPLAFY